LEVKYHSLLAGRTSVRPPRSRSLIIGSSRLVTRSWTKLRSMFRPARFPLTCSTFYHLMICRQPSMTQRHWCCMLRRTWLRQASVVVHACYIYI